MASTIEDRFSPYNFAVQYCKEVLEQKGPEYYLNLFQSLLNNVHIASSFKYFTAEDAYNFFLCYPQVFTICDGFVSLNIEPLSDIQSSMSVHNDLSKFIRKIRKEQTNKVYNDIYINFSSAVSEITEILPSIKSNLVYSIIFLLRNIHLLNLKTAFKTVLYTVENASSNFLDLPKTKKQMFVKAVCNILNHKLPETNKPSPVVTFRKGVFLFATYQLIERKKVSVNLFMKLWEKLNIHKSIQKHGILTVLRKSELIVINRTNSMSLSPSFESVNFIVESYSKLILQNGFCEDLNSNENEQDIPSLNAVGVDGDQQSTDLSVKEQNAPSCTKGSCKVQMPDPQSNQAEKLKSIKKEQDLLHSVRVSEADNFVETTLFVGSRDEYEASAKFQMADQKVTLNEREEKLLHSSFIIIKRYFKDALPHHIVLSFLLAFENVCQNFEASPAKDQLDFVERCCDSVNAWDSSSSDCNCPKLERSALTKEIILMICYLTVGSGGIHYLDVIRQLKNIDFSSQDYRENAFTQDNISGICFKNISNCINFGKKGILTLRPPFNRMRDTLKLKCVKSFPSNVAHNSLSKETAIKLEVSENAQITCKRFPFNKNWEELLNYSFFIIRKYCKDALLNYIILSFLLAYENVCENFAILSTEDQLEFLERCYSSINVNNSSPCGSNYNKHKSTLVKETDLILCYLVIKSGGIHYTDLLKLLENMGISVHIHEGSAFLEVKMYFQRICNYINLSRKGFLTLKPPFSKMKQSLRNKCFSAFSSNYVPSYACLDNNSLGYQISSENKNTCPEIVPSCSRYFHNQTTDCQEFEDHQTSEQELYSDQKVFDPKNIIDTSVFILSKL